MFRFNFKIALKAFVPILLIGCICLSCIFVSANDVSLDMASINSVFQTDYQGNGYMFNYLRTNYGAGRPVFSQRNGSDRVYGQPYWAAGINNVKFPIYRDVTDSNYSSVTNSLEYFSLSYTCPNNSGYDFGDNVHLARSTPLFLGIDIPFSFYNFKYLFHDFDNEPINQLSITLEKVALYISYSTGAGDNDYFHRSVIKQEFSYTDFESEEPLQIYKNDNFYECRNGTISVRLNKPVFLYDIKLDFYVSVAVAESLSNTWDNIWQDEKDEIAFNSKGLLILGQFNTIYGYSNLNLALSSGYSSVNGIFAEVFTDTLLNDTINSNKTVSDLGTFISNNENAISLYGSIMKKFNEFEFFSSIFVLFGVFAIISAFLGIGIAVLKKKGGD